MGLPVERAGSEADVPHAEPRADQPQHCAPASCVCELCCACCDAWQALLRSLHVGHDVALHVVHALHVVLPVLLHVVAVDHDVVVNTPHKETSRTTSHTPIFPPPPPSPTPHSLQPATFAALAFASPKSPPPRAFLAPCRFAMREDGNPHVTWRAAGMPSAAMNP